jgi:hypothetical protein
MQEEESIVNADKEEHPKLKEVLTSVSLKGYVDEGQYDLECEDEDGHEEEEESEDKGILEFEETPGDECIPIFLHLLRLPRPRTLL